MLSQTVIQKNMNRAGSVKNLQAPKPKDMLIRYGKHIQEAIDAMAKRRGEGGGSGGGGSSNGTKGSPTNGNINWKKVIEFLKDAAKKLVEQLEFIEEYAQKLQKSEHRDLLEKISKV